MQPEAILKCKTLYLQNFYSFLFIIARKIFARLQNKSIQITTTLFQNQISPNMYFKESVFCTTFLWSTKERT